jgi:hypothetical protein
MQAQASTARPKRRRGTLLLVALVVVVVATMASYSFTELMLAYDESAQIEGRRQQARQCVESGINHLIVFLAQTPEQQQRAGGSHSNAQLFQAQNVINDPDPDRRANFSIVAPGIDDAGQIGGLRFGLQNESTRIHLNALPVLDDLMGGALGALDSAGMGDAAASMASASGEAGQSESTSIAQTLLMSVPSMTVETADAILDWIDEDDEPRGYGCEREYYTALPTPYAPKNGPLDSIEELLLVRGVTPMLLFGSDTNRNGLVDPYEQPGVAGTMAVSGAASGGNGAAGLGPEVFPGWAAYFTLHSAEANRRTDGTPRINLNSDDLETLYTDLQTAFGESQWADNWASFIVAYRVSGQAGGGGLSGSLAGLAGGGANSGGGGNGAPGGGGAGGAGGTPTQPWMPALVERLNLARGGQVQLTQVLDLIDATVTIDGETYGSPFIGEPLGMIEYLPFLMAHTSTQNKPRLPARININECPVEILAGLPGMDREIADQIVLARADGSESVNRMYETWPMVEGYWTLEQMRQLLPLVTTGGDVHRAQVVGYYEGVSGFARAEVIIDGTQAKPQLLFWRNLSHLGRAFDVATLGLSSPDPLIEN